MRAGQPSLALDRAAGGWQPSGSERLPTGSPPSRSPAAELNRTYSAGQGRDVGLYIGYYRHQDYERKLVSSENALVTTKDRHWAQTAGGSQTLDDRRRAGRPFSDGAAARLRRRHWPAEKRSSCGRLYWIGGT